MGTRGRKPVPNELHEIRGNPGKRARTKAAPAPREGVPKCPEHLNDAAKREWFRVLPELMAMRVVTPADRAALAGYCMSFARWEEAEAMIEKSGGLVVNTKNGYPMQNPYLAIANRALEDVRKFAAEFGMTPSSRTRVATLEKQPVADPEDAFFGGPKRA